MIFDYLKEEHLIEIVRLYELHCGFSRDFKRVMFRSPDIILRELKEHKRREYRIGSRWEGHTKITIQKSLEGSVEVLFNSNFACRDRKGRIYKAAEKAGQEFVTAAMQYLGS